MVSPAAGVSPGITVSAPIGYTLPLFSVARAVVAVVTTRKMPAVKHGKKLLNAALLLLFFGKVSISGSFVSTASLRVAGRFAAPSDLHFQLG